MPEEKIYLTDFLSTFSLSRAESLMYDKKHAKDKSQRTSKDWSSITGLTKPKPAKE